jgi:hypothetical protein
MHQVNIDFSFFIFASTLSKFPAIKSLAFDARPFYDISFFFGSLAVIVLRYRRPIALRHRFSPVLPLSVFL